MSFRCDRCEDETERFGASYTMSLDYRDAQPDNPVEADDERGHLCEDCRDDFRNFLAGDLP